MSLTLSTIQKVLEKADVLWTDRIEKGDWVARDGSLKAVRENQTAQLQPLTDPNIDNKIQLVWLKPTNQVVEDYDKDCAFDGVPMSSAAKEYEISQAFRVGYRISEAELRTNKFTFEELVARQFLEADKLLTEKAAKFAVSKIEFLCATSKNPYNPNASWSVPPIGVSTIPQNEWTPDLLGHFIITAQLANFTNPFLVSGLNLAHRNWKAQKEAGQSGNEGNVEMFNDMKTYYDLWNIDGTTAANRTYLLNRGAFAFVTKSRWEKLEEFGNGANLIRYSMASNNMEGVRYDVRYRTICEGDTIDHVWEYILRCDVVTNPESVMPGYTGALGFHKA
jgi:hypothetical protein